MAASGAKAWIGLGGNLDRPAARIHAALNLLRSHPKVIVVRCSRLYRSPPWGLASQPDFVNAVAELRSLLEPQALLQTLLETEQRLGRVRDGQRWGPRRIDLDLLTYEDVVLRTTELELPHPRMRDRAFVLLPLLELDPQFLIPGVGSAAACLRSIDAREVAAVQPIAIEENESEQEPLP